MLTYPKSTKRVRRMPMHLSSGHVTLMPGKFSPLFAPLISPNRTWGAGRTHVGLCPKFLVFLFYAGRHACCLKPRSARISCYHFHNFQLHSCILKQTTVWSTRSERGLCTIPHCLKWYKLMGLLRIRLPTIAVLTYIQ